MTSDAYRLYTEKKNLEKYNYIKKDKFNTVSRAKNTRLKWTVLAVDNF